jgi:hypothetical protein
MLKEFNGLHKGARNPDGNLAGILIELKDAEVSETYPYPRVPS